MEVAVDCSWVGDAGVGVAFAGVKATWGWVSSVSGACVGTGVAAAGACVGVFVASGAGVLAGNGAVAAPGPGVAVGTGSGVSVGSAPCVVGLGADVASSTGAGSVATASLGVGVVSPQASRAASTISAIHVEHRPVLH
jgi:hypothetical protein